MSSPFLLQIMIDKSSIEKVVEQNIAETDKFIVEITIKSGNVISIVIDSDTFVSVDDCANINRNVYDFLESTGEDDFDLSVYSAGLSEPLKLERQYLKHLGKEVEIITKAGIKQKGILAAANNNSIELEYIAKEKDPNTRKKQSVKYKKEIELDLIKSTKLVIKV